MGLFDFAQAAGEKLDQVAAQAQTNVAAALTAKIQGSGISVTGLTVAFSEGKATLGGQVLSPADKQKLVLLVGNTQGVSQVEDNLTVPPPPSAPVGPPAPEFTFYTVKAGDTLSKIAQHTLGEGRRYPEIFEANKPMLKDPNHIYPGQVLRIPPKTHS